MRYHEQTGGFMGKVLDITSRVKSNKNQVNSKASEAAEVLDMTQARQEILTRDRRQVKRTILTEFVGAYVVLPEHGLMEVALYDISENGVSFDLDILQGQFQSEEEVAMRVYLNRTTYFPFTVKVTNVRVITDESIIRHGANFVKGTVNDVALHHFVKFIETVSVSLKKDDGDILVSKLS